jgi:excisionase family DNA binding protein
MVVETYLKTGQVAKMFSTSRQAVNYWIRKGQLPAYRMGRDYRVSLTDALSILKPVNINSES